jgi:hypothetical protein
MNNTRKAMRIYDYLFYKTFVLAKRSGNFDDAPALGGIVFVIGCAMMNVFAIVMFLAGLGVNVGFAFEEKYKYPFSIGLVALIYFYYSHKGRYKRIVGRYEAKAGGRKKIHPLIVAFLYVAASFGLLLLAGLFRNGDWIFAR